jgi:hypothetical protein
MKRPPTPPDPRRSAIAKQNRAKRKGLTAEGRERLRQSALKHQPWRFSTGPRTPEGKAKMAANAKRLQKGPRSVLEIRTDLADIRNLLREMREVRGLVVCGR